MVYVTDELDRGELSYQTQESVENISDVRKFIETDSSLYHNLKSCKASLVINREELIEMMPIQEFIQSFEGLSYRPTVSGPPDYQKVYELLKKYELIFEGPELCA